MNYSSVPAPGGINNSRILLDILCKRQNGLRICHFNAQSILPKIDEFKEVFNASLLDVICISETWLKAHITDEIIAITGYKFFRNDRFNRTGGGVAIYLRNSLRGRIVSLSDPGAEIEYIFVEIFAGSDKCLLGSVYRPPHSTEFSPLNNFLAAVCHAYQHIIIAGDFNVDMLNDTNSGNPVHEMIGSYSLSLINSLPTHFTSTSSTLLDLFLVADQTRVMYQNQLSFSAFSKHDLIFLTYDIDLSGSSESHVFTYRNFNAIDCSSLFGEASELQWECVRRTTSVHEQIYYFEYLINYLFEKYVPLKTHYIADTNCPWFTSRIRTLILQRNIAYGRWKRFRTPECWEAYRVLRNAVNLEIKYSKRRYFASKFDSKLPTKMLWRNLKNFGLNRSCNPDIDIDLDDLNNMFVGTVPDASSDPLEIPAFDSSYDGFSFAQVDQEEVFKAVFSVTSNAVGLDNIHPKFIKLLLPIILSNLTYIFNTIILTSVYPESWKLSKVIPIPKNPKQNPQEYRPISILSFLSKVFERLIHQQILKYIDTNNLMSNLQSGFRPKHSCTTALLKISDDIRLSMNSDMITVLSLLDFSKAFDKVNHSLLIYKLKRLFNFSSGACRLICSYLEDRQQKVCCGEYSSEFLPVCSGVPQGSILGPLLFSVFINDISSVILNCKFHLYADDCQLYISRPRGLMEDAVCRLNEDLRLISLWALQNKLLLNPLKSKAILLYRNNLDITDFPDVMLDETPIPYSRSVRNLGIIFNTTLTWSDHINSIVSKIYATLRKLSVASFVTPRNTRLMLVKQLIAPLITYGCELFCQLDSFSQRKITVAFNSAVRYVYGLRRYDHVSLYVKSVFGCTLRAYLDYRVILFLYNLIVKKVPSYLHEKLLFSRSSRTVALNVPSFSYRVTERQFFIYATRMWNTLPMEIRKSGGGDFRGKILDYFSYR